MILIVNDTAHCWENETSVAASPFECPCEFIKSTSFPVPTQICTAARVQKNIQGQKSLMHAAECCIIICVECHSLWQRALPNISNVKEDYFLLEILYFKGIFLCW